MLSDKLLKELRELMEERAPDKTFADREIEEAGNNLIGFFEILYQGAKRDLLREKKLKEHPKGFHLSDGTYSCIVCHDTIAGETSWWDLLGQKCLLCQQAVWDGVIPPFVCKNSDSYYAMWGLKSTFGISTPTAKKMVKEGILKACIILKSLEKPHMYLFLKKENPKLLTYERNHRLMTYACRCLDVNCNTCYRVVCLQKDCKIHPTEDKIEPRQQVITALGERKKKSLERTLNRGLDNHIRENNLRSAEKEQHQIEILKASIS